MANTQSKIDLLEEQICKLVDDNDTLRRENAEIKSENIELKAENVKLKQALEEHESRFIKLEQNDKDTATENAELKARVAKLEQKQSQSDNSIAKSGDSTKVNDQYSVNSTSNIMENSNSTEQIVPQYDDTPKTNISDITSNSDIYQDSEIAIYSAETKSLGDKMIDETLNEAHKKRDVSSDLSYNKEIVNIVNDQDPKLSHDTETVNDQDLRLPRGEKAIANIIDEQVQKGITDSTEDLTLVNEFVQVFNDKNRGTEVSEHSSGSNKEKTGKKENKINEDFSRSEDAIASNHELTASGIQKRFQKRQSREFPTHQPRCMQKLRGFLTEVATGSSKYREKANDILQNLHLTIKSRSVEEYWERIKMLKLKQQLNRTKKLKAEYFDSELNHLGESSKKREQLDNQRVEVENFPEGDDYLTDPEEISQKKDEIDTFFQSPPDIAKDVRAKSGKRRSMKDTESKSAKPPKRNKSSKKIVVDAGQSTSVSSMDVQQTPSGTEDSIVDTTCDESESPVEKNTREKAEKSRTILSWGHVDKIKISNNSDHDWLVNGYNISRDFREFQTETVDRIKNDPTLSYATDLDEIMANGESSTSKERRKSDDNKHGRKPDFRVLFGEENEFIFGEIKPPRAPNNAINHALVKLGVFMKGSLDSLHKQFGYSPCLETFGCIIKGYQIELFSMDLPFDGLYRFKQIGRMLLPTENANFLNLASAISYFYSLLERVDRSIEELNKPSTPTGLSYHKESHSSPHKTHIPILNIPPPSID
ncbi:13221_t:CDS:10 [Acaulospora colombiana]|uniref:13221_t:CDS:1 n=1 Tax=Acaulospora colombiana TaxID=27376 RepID=A0ACA9KX80_9GLOM|nr:13221_t:CDS:10 [Acaulospora colombiana]